MLSFTDVERNKTTVMDLLLVAVITTGLEEEEEDLLPVTPGLEEDLKQHP
jgi:hypothetical protein